MMNRIIHLVCLALLCIPLLARAENWPQFRGPGGAGISAEKSFPTHWSDSKNLKWKTPLPGPGSSSPIVWGERVFITCYTGYGIERGEGDPSQLKRHLLCMNHKDGSIAWKQTVDSAAMEDRYTGYISEHGYASHTPATDGERVYAFFGKTGVVAFDMDGKKLWQTSVGTMSGNRRWGSAASPVLYKNLVIVNAADEDRAIYGLDKLTGKVVWKAPGDSLELTYGTPVLAPVEKDTMELLIAVPGEIWSLNPDTGKLRWFGESPLAGNISPSVVADDENVYAFGGFPRTGSAGFRRKGTEDRKPIWSSNTGSYVPTPVLQDGKLYWVDDRGTAYCMDARPGRILYSQPLEIRGRGKVVYAGTLLAGGRLYSVTRTAGTVVWEPGNQYSEIARNRFESDASDFNASPAFSNGAIFLRSNKFLYCIE